MDYDKFRLSKPRGFTSLLETSTLGPFQAGIPLHAFPTFKSMNSDKIGGSIFDACSFRVLRNSRLPLPFTITIGKYFFLDFGSQLHVIHVSLGYECHRMDMARCRPR